MLIIIVVPINPDHVSTPNRHRQTLGQKWRGQLRVELLGRRGERIGGKTNGELSEVVAREGREEPREAVRGSTYGSRLLAAFLRYS